MCACVESLESFMVELGSCVCIYTGLLIIYEFSNRVVCDREYI